MGRLVEFNNFLNTIRSWLKNENTVERTYTFPNKSMTVAGTDDVAAAAAAAAAAKDDLETDVDFTMVQSFKSLHKY